MKIALVDDEQKYLDEMTELVRSFGTQRFCRIETVPFLSGEAFLEAFESGGFSCHGNRLYIVSTNSSSEFFVDVVLNINL